VASLQDYCLSLSVANDTEWEARYKALPSPRPGAPVPLRGCVLGCLVGADSYARGLRFSAGAWSGKWCVLFSAGRGRGRQGALGQWEGVERGGRVLGRET
jgi:hypothetical protein